MSITAAALAAVLLAVTPQGAQVPVQTQAQTQAQAQDEGTRVGDVEVVGGRRLREAVDLFADTVVAPPIGRNPGRWTRTVCVGTVNLKRQMAQAIIDRVSQIGSDVGLEIGEPGCAANILILGTDDGNALASTLVDYRPAVFRPGWGGASRSVRQLERFQQSGAAVRWWHVALPIVTETGQIAVRLPGGDPPRIPGGSLIRTSVHNDLTRAIIIVDFERASSLTFEQLSDYIAMVAFAQVDPDADMSGFSSVLNVFTDPTAATGITNWDMAYLNGLYDVELNRRSPSQTAGAIGRIMIDDLEGRRRTSQH